MGGEAVDLGSGKNAFRIGRIWESVKLSLSIYWRERRAIPILCALAVVLRVALPYLGILDAQVVLDQIGAQAAPVECVLAVSGMALLLVAVYYLKGLTDSIVQAIP